MDQLTDAIKAEALRLGFDLVGTAPVRPSEHERLYREWIAAGRHGEMAYLGRAGAGILGARFGRFQPPFREFIFRNFCPKPRRSCIIWR